MAPLRASLFLLPIIYLGFISLGLPDGTLGVAWPPMHRSLALPIGMAGTLMLVITLLSALSSFSSGRVIARFRTGPVVLASCAATGTSLLIIAHAGNLGWLLLAAAPLGLGAGAVDAGLNGFVARHYSGRHMNWLHACWGIGATCGPLIMAHAVGSAGGWRSGYLVIGSVQLALAVLFLLTLGLWRTAPTRSRRDDAPHVLEPPTLGANSRAGWLSAIIFAVYVAVEGSAGLWAGSILVEARGVPAPDAGRCVTAFYASITIGRILVGFIVERVGSRALITGGGLLAALGALGFALAPGTGLAAVSLVVLGLGYAPIYPGLMHEVPVRFAPDAVQTVIGRQSGAACIGAAGMPAIAGLLAQVSLESITWVIVGGTVVLIALVAYLDRLTPTHRPIVHSVSMPRD